MKFAIALCALLFAVPASASTYQVSVSGQFDSVTLLGIQSGSPDFLPDITYQPGDADYGWVNYASLLQETSGSAVVTDGVASDCVGMLVPLCRTSIFEVSTSEIFGRYFFGWFDVDETSIFFTEDARRSWFVGSTGFSSLGIQVRGSIDTLSVAEVPLPQSAFLLLAGLAALRFQRWFNRATGWRGARQAV